MFGSYKKGNMIMKKRFSMGKDESDFTQPCKLTRQKRWFETPKEFVQLEHKALCMLNIVKINYIHLYTMNELKLERCLYNNLGNIQNIYRCTI